MEETRMNIKVRKLVSRKWMSVLCATTALCAVGMSAQASDDGIEFGEGTAVFTCEDLSIDNLRYGFNTYVTLTNEVKDRLNLNNKLDIAEKNDGDGKYCSARLKVSDFGVKLNGLYIGRNGKSKASDKFGGKAIKCLVIGAEHEAIRFAEKALDEGEDCGAITQPPRGKGPKN
jgi:hypothetical protein